MKLIQRYITRTLGRFTLFTLLALLGLYAFFDIVQEAPQLGQGNYNTAVMLHYTALLVPGHAYELMPLAVLIGVMAAMTSLVNTSEYTVIRTSGISLRQIASGLLRFGTLFALLTILLGEFAAPWCGQEAERIKLQSTHSMVAQEFRSGIWVKDNANFINAREMLPDGTLRDLHIYTYDAQYRLARTRTAERATFARNEGGWILENVRDTLISDTGTRAVTSPVVHWKSVIVPSILNVLLVVPEQMSATNLFRYIEHLRSNSQQTQRYEIALWGKLFYPLACISMALVALAFTPRQARHGQLGLRLFAGISLGIAFHFINRLFGYLGLLHGWNPPLTATLPTLLFLLAGLAMILRQERR